MTARGCNALPARVGYILKMFPRLSETFILNEVLELEAQRVPIEIFSLKQPVDKVIHADAATVKAPVAYLPERFWQAPLSMARAHVRAWRRFPRTWRHLARNSWRRSRSGDFIAFSQACFIASHSRRFSHFHAHYANVPAKVALLVHRLTGASYSITTHAKDIFQNEPFASTKLCERMCRASFLVANSRFSADHIRKHLPAPHDVRVIYNGLDLAKFPRRQEPPPQPIVLGVGRLVEKKGFQHFVAMCRLLKDKAVPFKGKIVGTGVLSSSLKEQIRSLDVADRVSLAGPLPHEALIEVYRHTTVFVLPCKQAADGDRDILPNVIKEAMAVGVPVVTTRLDGIEELVEDGVSGLLVPPDDPAALAAKVRLVLENRELAATLSTNARRVIEERFDRVKNFALLRGAFEEILQPAPLPAPASDPVVPHHTYGTSCVH